MNSSTAPAIVGPIRSALTAAHQLGRQQIETPCRLPGADQNSALRVLAFIAANHPNWEPGETSEALAADPIAADLWACLAALAQGVA